MNKRMVFFMLGRIVLLEAFLLILPAACSLIYKEDSFYAFLAAIGIAAIIGIVLSVLNRPKDRTIFAKEGFAIVALAWILLSAVGALPFVVSGEIPSYIDAFFETVSGFTTTGASIITDIESKSHGILLWRSFTHWIGGMGVLVLMMAIFPTDAGRSMHIIRAEMPGPIIGKLVPKMKATARVLYLIYIALTATEIIFLLISGMPLFESLVCSLGTAGTGGFGIKADGLASLTPYQQWIITVFMLIFGINFNLYYLILTKKIITAIKSEELWFYLSIVGISVTVIAFDIYGQYGNTADSLRHSAFQVASIISTTGYATTDFNSWSTLSKGILMLFMFTGACAGSTAGGLKLSRVIILFKSIRSNLKHMLHSRSVDAVRFEGKRLDNATITNVYSYFALYSFCIAIVFFILCFEPFDLETNISAAVSCFNNIGPGFSAVGPMSSYAGYSDLATAALSFTMLLGRLEIYPMLLLFSPTVWKRRVTKD